MKAARADSFITLPRFPVSSTLPEPGDYVGLGLQKGAPYGGPGQAVDQAHLVFQAVLFRVELPGTQELLRLSPRHMGLLVLLRDDPP